MEWKRGGHHFAVPNGADLETFLGGMETVRGKARRPFGNTPLKPPWWNGNGRSPQRFVFWRRPLKPSLVEWKLGAHPVGRAGQVRLETFLGGMETASTRPR